MPDANVEKFRWIAGYVGKYKISNHGRILSVYGKGKLLVPIVHKSGHLKINLADSRGIITHLISRLVLQTFDRPPRGPERVVHLDKNLENNHIDNLEWSSGSKS